MSLLLTAISTFPDLTHNQRSISYIFMEDSHRYVLVLFQQRIKHGGKVRISVSSYLILYNVRQTRDKQEIITFQTVSVSNNISEGSPRGDNTPRSQGTNLQKMVSIF